MAFPDYFIIIFYLALMVYIGFRCRNASSNFSDYIRMGSRSTWWLAGSSAFMGMFSAITFTGVCGSAYLAGWSVLVVFWGNALMFFIQGCLFAPLLRRTRADTPQDVVRLRFGARMEQFLSYFGTLTSFIWGGTFLLSLATFLSVVFHLPVWALILIVGGVVVFYSVAGGSWGVQITDSLQAILLVAVTTTFAILCLIHVGGISGLFAAIDAAGLRADFALIKPQDHVYQTSIPIQKGFYTGIWLIAMIANSVLTAANLQSSYRYLSLRDEREASKAAFLASFLMLFGSVIWFIPPMVGRLFFSGEIESLQGLSNQADAAYAVTAVQLLPPGLIGLIVVSMAAATMSSMDSFLNGVAGIIVKNIYLPLMERLQKPALSGLKLMRLTQATSLVLGLYSIAMAFLLLKLGGSGGIFGILMTVAAYVIPPLSVPIIWSILFRRVPLWGFGLSMVMGVMTSVGLLVWQKVSGESLDWNRVIFIMNAVGSLPVFVSMLFWKNSGKEYKHLVDQFFELIHRPVIADDEVGANIAGSLTRTVGAYVLVSAAAIACLLPFAEGLKDAAAILSITFFLLLVGLLMRSAGRAG